MGRRGVTLFLSNGGVGWAQYSLLASICEVKDLNRNGQLGMAKKLVRLYFARFLSQPTGRFSGQPIKTTLRAADCGPAGVPVIGPQPL